MDLQSDLKTVFIVILLGFLGWYFFIRDDKSAPTAAPAIAEQIPPVPAPLSAYSTTEQVAAPPASISVHVEGERTIEYVDARPVATPRLARTPRPASTPPPLPLPSEFPHQDLLKFVRTNIDRICSPLEDPRGSQIAMTELHNIRVALAHQRTRLPVNKATTSRAIPTTQENSSASTSTREMEIREIEALQRTQNQAEALCQQIYTAIAERYTHEARLATGFSKSSRALSDPGKTDDFFERNIRSAWEHKANQLHRDIQKASTALQQVEYR